ncbi:MAG: hypothetical protein CM1200mP40_35280 [Gammaproteobacteria bacterium]|nr:MAG: hypothetical protein CM1200mP40_35280 [Gammaproteobacteria bacterium]
MARLPGGIFFIYQGFNENTGWMHTSSRADAIDEYLETIVQRDDGVYYVHGDEEKKLEEKVITVSYKDGDELLSRDFTTYRSHHGPIVRGEDDKWVAFSIMEEPIKALSQSYGRKSLITMKNLQQLWSCAQIHQTTQYMLTAKAILPIGMATIFQGEIRVLIGMSHWMAAILQRTIKAYTVLMK